MGEEISTLLENKGIETQFSTARDSKHVENDDQFPSLTTIPTRYRFLLAASAMVAIGNLSGSTAIAALYDFLPQA